VLAKLLNCSIDLDDPGLNILAIKLVQTLTIEKLIKNSFTLKKETNRLLFETHSSSYFYPLLLLYHRVMDGAERVVYML
jgi:hypothetical protein